MEDHTEYMNRLIKEMISRNFWQKLVTNEILTTPKADLLYCAVSKSACTQIKFILADLARYPEKMDRSLAPYKPANSGLIAAALLEDKNEIHRLFFDEEVFRFAFVRNPLTRLASAFSNKLKFNFYTSWENEKREILETRYSNQVHHIKKSITGITPDTLALSKQPLTFKEFVYFVYDQDPYQMDRHWYHQNRAIFHDVLDFHFIGKVENFNDDIRQVLESLQAPADLYNFREKQNAANISYKLEDYYDSELERLAVKKFEEDFDLFEYPKYQVRPFQSTFVEQKYSEPETYARKISSLKEPDLKNSIGVVLLVEELSGPELRRLEIIREKTSSDISFYIGARATGESVMEGSKILKNTTVVDITGQHGSAAYNTLIKQVKEPFILFFMEGFLPGPDFQLSSALKIFQLDSSIRVIGATTDGKIAQADQAAFGNQPGRPQKFIHLPEYHQLILSPSFLYHEPRYFIDEFDYGYCDMVEGAFLAEKDIFLKENLWLDESIKDDMQALVDLFLRIHSSKNMKTAETSAMQIVLDRLDPDETQEARGVKRLDTTFFVKWDLLRLTLFGKFVQEFNPEKQLAYEYPFALLDCLGNMKENEKQVLKYKIKNKETEEEIRLLEDRIHEIKTSPSWKVTTPFRTILGMIRGERRKN